jgi:hypothetical protein
MAQAAERIDSTEAALEARVDSLVAAHQGDARAVIETLLLAIDARTARISFGFVRGRLPDIETRPMPWSEMRAGPGPRLERSGICASVASPPPGTAAAPPR